MSILRDGWETWVGSDDDGSSTDDENLGPTRTTTEDSVADDEYRLSDLPTEFLKDPEKFIKGVVATWVVATILRGTDWFATIILRAWAGVAGSFEAGLDALAVAYSIPFNIVTDVVTLYGDTAAAAASGSGIVAPLVALVFVAIPVLVFVAIAQFTVGFLDTYLPLSAIPIVGRWLE